MEDRAKFVLIGLFTFAVIAGAFGFVYWLHANAGTEESATYRVIFDGSVTGLRVGAPVLFNGIRVGDVTSLQLTKDPAQVAALLSIDKNTPVRSDTRVTLEFSGLTGIASVSLKGVLASSPPLKAKDGELPTLKAESNAGQDLSSAVRETLGTGRRGDRRQPGIAAQGDQEHRDVHRRAGAQQRQDRQHRRPHRQHDVQRQRPDRDQQGHDGIRPTSWPTISTSARKASPPASTS